ncbi:dihydrolipoyl dehydrogenase [Anoxynatronum buryatiense]|nr:dihydrolipoyl dehydrogenase [Anoxynatronum buryatiense]
MDLHTANKSITIIGGGPGGYSAALTAAKLGAKVTLIEKNKLGGTCLNEGCIPTKALLKCAEVNHLFKKAEMYGIESTHKKFDYAKAINFKNQVVAQIVGGVEQLIKASGIKYIQGEGRVVDTHTVAIKKDAEIIKVHSQSIIIASGAKETAIPGLETDGINIFNSSQILSSEKLPTKLVIIGGGVIGVEFASIFSSLCVDVTLIELTDRLIAAEDEDLSAAITKALMRKGVTVLLDTQVQHVDHPGQNDMVLTVITGNGDVELINCDQILVCVGRQALTSDVGLSAVNIQIDDGRVRTDKFMQTNVEGIYAIGDITQSEQLAHIAYYEARTAVQHIMGMAGEVNYKAIPHCIFSSPEIAIVGHTETSARKLIKQVGVVKYPFYCNGKAVIELETEGFVKLIYDKTSGHILGVTIIGTKATELIATYTLAINNELTVMDIVNTVHAHPTLSEALHETALMAAGLDLHVL